MKYGNFRYFRPPDDYDIGIRGGPILPGAIVNDPAVKQPLEPRPGRYALLYSPVTPTGQRLALIAALGGFLDLIAVLSPNNGRLIQRSGDGSEEPSPAWAPMSGTEAAAFEWGTHVRLPALVDLEAGRIISNDPYLLPVKIVSDLAESAGRKEALALLQEEEARLEWEERIFYDLHCGVYRAGFVARQDEYEREVERVYRFLADLDRHLTGRRCLLGDFPTLADLWLYTLLVRYDQVYAPGFRLHKYRIRDFVEVHRYLRELHALPACRATTDFALISRGYFLGIPVLNRGIVPIGPDDHFL
jgi:putative glutathione S-transferase